MPGAPGDDEGSTTNETSETNEPGGSIARRRRALQVLLALFSFVVIAAFFWPWQSERASAARPRAEAAAAPSAATSEPTAPASPDAGELPPAVERYLEATIYPPGTGRLSESSEDLLRPNSRYEDYRKILDTYSSNPDEVVSVRLTTDHFFYTGDEVVELDLRVKRGETRIDPLSVEAHAEREGRSGREGDPIPIRFHPEAGAHVARLDTARFADHHGPIVVDARIEYAPNAFHDETLRFFFTPPGRIPARFTGEIEDRLVNGSLRVGVGLDVEEAGFYRLDANLYDRFGNPVGYSSFKGELGRGQRVVPIEFFGRLLRDVGTAGPFLVGEIRGYRFLDGQYPDRERIPDLPGRFQTAAYDLQRFSDDEHTSEHKERMVQLLLEDASRGLSIDAPPLPADSPNP